MRQQVRSVVMSALFTVASLSAAACVATEADAPGPLSPASVQSANAKWADASAESLTRGRELFLEKCKSCHGYPNLVAHGDDEWPAIIQEMGSRAHLSPEDSRLVLRFVLAAKSP